MARFSHACVRSDRGSQSTVGWSHGPGHGVPGPSSGGPRSCTVFASADAEVAQNAHKAIDELLRLSLRGQRPA